MFQKERFSGRGSGFATCRAFTSTTGGAETFLAAGGLPRVFLHRALELGVPKAKLTDLGEERPPSEVYERVFGLVTGRTLLFATGNTVGYGESLIAYFESRADAHGRTRTGTDYGS